MAHVGVEGGVVQGDLLQLAAVAGLHVVVAGHDAHVHDGELRDVLHVVVPWEHGLVAPAVALAVEHEGVDVEGEDLRFGCGLDTF